jgi:adenylate cyclase
MNAVGRLRFEGFILDTSAGTLTKGGKLLALRPQPLKVLAYLAEHSGELVTNKELIEGCWGNPKQTHINSLAQCIKSIREALGETDQVIIRTIHGRGYVFATPVSTVPMEAQAVTPPPKPIAQPPEARVPPAATPPPPLARRLPEWGRLLRAGPYRLAAAVVVAALLFGGWAVWSHATRPIELTMEAVPSVAVLPFKATNDDEPGRREAESLTNDIVTELLRFPRGYSLRIRSAPAYNNGSLPHPRAAGRELGVRYLVVGTTRREGDARPVNVQIIEADSGRPVWAAPFSFRPDDRGAQNRAAALIARMLLAGLMRTEVQRPLPARPEAGHFTMLGRSLMSGEGGVDANRRAMAYFDKARALDADSVPALLGYARTRVNQVLNRWTPKEGWKGLLDEAEPAIQRAVRLDPFNPGVHVLRGGYLRATNKDAEAIAEFERAITLYASYAGAHAELGRAKIEIGLSAPAVGHIEEAIALSPSDPYIFIWYYWAGMAEAHSGHYDKAVAWLLASRGANRAYPNTIVWLAVAYAGAGEWDKARSYIEQHRSNFPKFSLANWRLAMPHGNAAVTEQRLRIEALLRQLGAPETTPADDKVQTNLVR